MKAYLKLLLTIFRWKIPVFIGLLLSLALIQGISIAMLIPLLDVLGNLNSNTSGFGASMTHWINLIGLDLSLELLLGLFLVLMLINASLKIIIQLYDKRLQNSLLLKLKTDFLALMTHCQWTYYQQLKQSDLHHTLTRDINQINRGFYLTLSMAATIITTIIYIAIACQISITITLLASAFGLLLLISLRHKFKQAKKIGEKQFSNSQKYTAITSEHIQNMKLVKSFGLENKHLTHFSQVIQKMMQHQLAHHKNGLSTKLFYELGGAIALSAIIYIGIHTYQIAVSELIVLILIFSRLSPRFQQFQTQLQQFLQILPIHKAFVKQSAFLQQHQIHRQASSQPITFKQEITFKSLYFHYPNNSKKDVLIDINLSIPAYQTTAIIGPSGAGKSTLIDLLTGLHTPIQGTISIDNQLLNKNNLFQWQKNLAYVTQEVMLFNDTLRNNLIWMVDQAEDHLIWQALKDASADTIVKSLPQGLDTYLGDQGVILSGGEKQRIALARALICQPKVLILDEATSALDCENDAFIQQTIKQYHGKLTIIVIAHRLSSIPYADQIIVLKQGKVLETGTWKTFINNQNSYIAQHTEGYQ